MMTLHFGKSGTQQMCILSWKDSWTPLQISKFNQALSEELLSNGGQEEILFGLENMDLTGDSHQMFACQLRLFRSWFKSWDAQDRQTFIKTVITDPTTHTFLAERKLL